MAYSGPPAPPPPFDPPPVAPPAERPPRPVTVTAAAGLMFFQVVLALLGGIMAIANKDIIRDAAEAQQPADGPQMDTDMIVNIGLAFGVGLNVVIAIVFVVLALLNMRGSNVARIITWVVCGLFLCCVGFGFIGSFQQTDAVPGWYTAYSIINAALGLLIYIGVIVLLALPISNKFFKPTQPNQLY